MKVSAEIFGTNSPSHQIDLYAFHHAGGSRLSFAGWKNIFPDWLGVHRVQLPFRTPESSMEMPRCVRSIIPGLAIEFLRDRACRHTPFYFYGHSLGALVAFELVRYLRARMEALPYGLVVAGRRAPQCSLSYMELCSMDDDVLMDAIVRLGGVPNCLEVQRNWLRSHLPVIRADLMLSDRYTYEKQHPLDIPILAIKGFDDPILSIDELSAWEAQTRTSFRSIQLPGSHFLNASGNDQLETLLSDTLSGWDAQKWKSKNNTSPCKERHYDNTDDG